MNYQISDPQNIYYSDVDFDNLMAFRVRKILLLCSKYDAFMLEEDGRIDEQIFNEYVQLNLRYPPQFIQVTTAEEALEILEKGQINLIINMLSVRGMDPFELSRKMKRMYKDIPLVILSPMSREITMKLNTEDLTGVDYIFSWLGT